MSGQPAEARTDGLMGRILEILGIVLLFACVIDAPWSWARDEQVTPVGIARLVGVIVGVVLLLAGVILRRRAKQPAGGQPPGSGRLPTRDAGDLEAIVDRVTRRFAGNPDRLDLYRNFLLSHRTSIARAVEEYSVDGNSLRQQVNLQFVVGPELVGMLKAEESVYLPILKVRKGALLDNLDVTDASGQRLSVLPYPTVLGLQLFTLHTLFTTAFRLVTPGAQNTAVPAAMDQSTVTRVVTTRERLMEHIARYGPMDPQYETETVRRLDGLAALLRKQPTGVNEDLFGLLRDFVECFGRVYPVVAEVPTPPGSDRLLVAYSKNVRLHFVDEGRKDRLRKWIGLSPYKFRLPVTLAYLAQSYHFRMRLDTNRYVYDQQLRDVQLNREVDLRSEEGQRIWGSAEGGQALAQPQPYVRIRRRAALPYAHLYIRDMNHAWPRPLATVVRFHEVPPGGIGAACVLALVNFAFVASIGSLITPGTALTSDIPALLLALPAVSAGLLGQNLDHQLLRETSLTTRFGLFLTFLFSGVGILLYLAQSDGGGDFGQVTVELFGGNMTLPIHDRAWLALTAVSLLNGLWMLRTLVIRTNTFKEMADRQLTVDQEDVVFTGSGDPAASTDGGTHV